MAVTSDVYEIWRHLTGREPPFVPHRVYLDCPVCGGKKKLMLNTWDSGGMSGKCFKGCDLSAVRDASAGSGADVQAAAQRKNTAEARERKAGGAEEAWDMAEPIPFSAAEEYTSAAERYLAGRLSLGPDGYKLRHKHLTGRGVRSLGATSAEYIHLTIQPFLPRGVSCDHEKGNNLPFGIAFGYMTAEQTEPTLIQILPLQQNGHRYRNNKTPLSVGALTEGSVCEAMNFSTQGPLILAESPVSAMAAAFLYGRKTGKPPAMAAASYGAGGITGIDIDNFAAEVNARDGETDITDAIWAADGDAAGLRAADEAERRGCEIWEAPEGEDHADLWKEHLKKAAENQHKPLKGTAAARSG